MYMCYWMTAVPTSPWKVGWALVREFISIPQQVIGSLLCFRFPRWFQHANYTLPYSLHVRQKKRENGIRSKHFFLHPDWSFPLVCTWLCILKMLSRSRCHLVAHSRQPYKVTSAKEKISPTTVIDRYTDNMNDQKIRMLAPGYVNV